MHSENTKQPCNDAVAVVYAVPAPELTDQSKIVYVYDQAEVSVQIGLDWLNGSIFAVMHFKATFYLIVVQSIN